MSFLTIIFFLSLLISSIYCDRYRSSESKSSSSSESSGFKESISTPPVFPVDDFPVPEQILQSVTDDKPYKTAKTKLSLL
ncbi:Protein CBG27217 [Caenorhabditis briggsae]|uniref:Protein CBG27217 n=1 Tax=Caenorhabditis briggsae TaxID=6238 RepID=B6IFU0_CAEBR|nr:Protein CBG27217 [Caenorhabditis briggsae]CAR98756.1 Protein CBG27217 [Caenorhabditis briggsae]